ncbi:hypothetical protein BDZ45DRAFT_254132 [Acephala macrosclerotiorum]|nr:hypothetical protein BDZ45DRAFT_254132 [Acephala macrosclerotiorum]
MISPFLISPPPLHSQALSYLPPSIHWPYFPLKVLPRTSSAFPGTRSLALLSNPGSHLLLFSKSVY